MEAPEAGENTVEPANPPASGDLGILAVDPAKRYRWGRWGREDWKRYLKFGKRREPTPSFTGLVEDPEEGRVGIACSGGGIRSAAFNLGALQSLQGEKVLERSTYLSAVSGGSYIAAAFCMVRKTTQESAPSDPPQPSDDSDAEFVNDEHPPFFPGSPEEQYLRNHASYLAPGMLGKIRLGHRVLVSLVANLAFIGLFLVSLAVPLAIFYGWIFPSLGQRIAECNVEDGAGKMQTCGFTPLHVPTWIWALLIGLVAVALLAGLASVLFYEWGPRLRSFSETWSQRIALAALGAGVLLVAVPELLALVRTLGEEHTPTAGEQLQLTALIGGSGVVTVGTAILLQLRAQWVEARKRAQQAGAAVRWYTKLPQRLRSGLAYLIAALVGPAVALLLILVVMSAMLNRPEPLERWFWAGGLIVAFAIAYYFVDLTTWSLHPFYRRRLASAFALKRIRPAQGEPVIAAEQAGIAVERDYDRLVRLSETGVAAGGDGKRSWPTLLVCAAANISDDAATPPGRSVTSFTFSASAMGGPLVGAASTREMEERCDERGESHFTLPAAVAMSGAALSPSMGKMTRRPVRLLMGIANLRLGVWVPNPRWLARYEEEGRRYPRPRPSYLLRELFGLNPINSPFLYVTDGGHYENLGVMELLRRGCTEVYCFDASNDEFDALGDLVSLARSELGVEVEIDRSDLVPADNGFAKSDCVRGKIRYPARDGKEPVVGKLYYVRPVMTQAAPADVVAYHAKNPRFPRDPTADQLYTDQRFEAYRALGLLAGRNSLRLSGVVSAPERDRVPSAA